MPLRRLLLPPFAAAVLVYARRRKKTRQRPTPANPQGDPDQKLHESLDSAATWLVGGFATLTAALTAFGAVSGGLTRMLRNYPALSLGAAILISLAIGFGVATKTFTTPGKHKWLIPKWLVRLGALLFVGGLALAVSAATQAPHGRERPQITASLNYENGLTLVGRVTASDLRWTEFMDVSVFAAKLKTERPVHWEAQKFLYVSHIGPDADGKVDLVLHVPIRGEGDWDMLQVAGSIGSRRSPPPFPPDCSPQAPATSGCLGVRLPVARRPQVSATWSATGDRPALTVTTRAQDQPSTDLIRTTILARSKRKIAVLSQALISPDSKGDVAHTQVVPVSISNSIVCVVAERLSGNRPERTPPPSAGVASIFHEGRPRCPLTWADAGLWLAPVG